MKALQWRVAVTLSTLVFSVLLTLVHTESQAGPPAVDPTATGILKRMTDYLGSVQQFSVQTQNTLEDLLDSGHRIDLDVSAEVVVSRPNKLRSERKGDLVNQVFYYDGKTLTLYNPSSKVYAIEQVPGSFKGLFQYMYESLGFGIPASDLIYSDAYTQLMQDVSLAAVVGKTEINGVRCDHLLFSRPGVDFQVWIAEGSKPLPYKYVVTDTATPAKLSVSTFMNEWNLEPTVDDALFTFVPPKGTQKINFMPF